MKRSLILVGAVAALGTLAAAVRAGVDATAPEPIGDVPCLRKLALDLTHRGPTSEEVAELEAGSASLGDLAERYMASPEFSEVVFNWYRRQFPPTGLTPAGVDHEEPARIAHHVVVGDRDYRELLTATYTVSAEGAELPVTDKPAAGVISTQHYMSAYQGSLRRNWAGRFEREWTGIVLDPVTLPEGTPVDTSRDGLASNPECAACHVNPIYGVDFLARFADCYTPDGLPDAACAPQAGSFLTETATGLPALGALVVATREFKSQAVNFFFRQLFGRPLAREESGFYLDAAARFEQSGFRPKTLIKHLVTSQAYCAR